MKKLLWRAMLNSDFNERYWRAVTHKYAKYDLHLKIFLAVTASGTVAGWSIWQDHQSIWKFLSACAALASIASPLLSYGKKMEVAASHAGTWADLRVRYADLWDTYASKGETDFVSKEYTRLKKIFIELESKEPKLKIPDDGALAKKCQQDVLKSKRLIKEK
jgi:hypothetical protein